MLGNDHVINSDMTPYASFAIVLTFCVLGFSFYTSQSDPSQQAEPKCSELTRDNIASLDRQRALVAAAAKQRYGVSGLVRTKADLPVLQRLIDERAFAKTQIYELQSLGVVLGDVMASELPLRWMMVTDGFGTDPTLRYKDTTIQVGALTMISKRIERDEKVNVSRLLEITREQLPRFEKELTK